MALPIGRANKRRQAEPEPAPAETEQDPELTSYLAALTPDPETDTTLSGNRFGNSEEYQVRLTAVADQQLRELAELRDTTPKRLVQEWVQQRLAWEADQELGR